MFKALADAEFTCQSRRVARAFFEAQREPVYRYLFNHALENDQELKALGATHTVEHPLFFAWQGKYQRSDTDRVVQQNMVGYWTRMAKAGNPNGGSDPEWPAYSPENDAYLEIGATTVAKRALPKRTATFGTRYRCSGHTFRDRNRLGNVEAAHLRRSPSSRPTHANFNDSWRQTGVLTGKILSGAKPAELAVQQAVKIELVINLQTAKSLGLMIPPILLARADEVME